MSVTKEIIRLEKSNVKLNLTIPKEEVFSQYQDLLKDYVKSAQLPGFRKGKVPRDVLERKFGEALKGEALSKIIEKTVGEIFEDKNLPKDERPLPYSYPQMEEHPKLDFGEDLNFAITYDVLPKVQVNQWKGLEIEVPEVAISEDDIARELEEIQERNSIVLDRDDGAEAQDGDVVTVNYSEIGEDGEVTPNTEREDFAFTLGSKNNIYKMDEHITGMKKGETREFTVTYPQDVSGETEKTVKLRVTMTALKEKKLPELDDDLAQDVDEQYKTLDDLKNSIRTRLENSLALRIKDLKINKLLEKIMENTPVVLPESMIRVELDGRLRNLARRFGTDTETILNMMSQPDSEGPEAVMESWRPATEIALRSRLIVDTLLEEQHIEVSDAEIEQEIEKIAADTHETLEKTKERYTEEGAQEYLKDNLKEQKFFDLLLAENTVKAGPKTNYLDLMENNR